MANLTPMIKQIADATGQSVDDVLKWFSKKRGAIAPPPNSVSKLDDLAEEAGPLVKRGSSDIVPVPNQVIGGPNKYIKPVGETIDASFGPIKSTPVSNMDAAFDVFKKEPALTSAGVAAAGAGAYSALSGGGDEVPPMMTPPPGLAKEKEQPIMSDDLMAKQQAEALDQGGAEKIKPSSKSGQAGQDEFTRTLQKAEHEKEAERSGPSREDMYADRLNSAQDADSQNQFLNTLIRAGNQAGSAIAGTKADYSGVEGLEKGAGKNVANFKEGMKTRADSMALQKAENEAADEAKSRDPNSEGSKSLRDKLSPFMKLTGNESEYTLNKALPQIVQLINVREAAESRKQTAQTAREDKQFKEKNTLDEQRKRREMLKPGQISGINALDDEIKNLDEATALLGKNSGFVGPLDDLYPNAMVGDKMSGFRAASGMIGDIYRHKITGAGAGSTELNMLRSRVPNSSDNMKQYAEKSKVYRAALVRRKNEYLKDLNRAGHNVSEFEDGSGLDQEQSKSSGSQGLTTNNRSTSFPIQVRKDGQVTTVDNEAELQEARTEGWK